jgi:UDP-glucose 4-epimerase
MRALVTGGAGFIGSHLVGELLAQGHEVVVLDNLLTGDRRYLPAVPQLRFIFGSVTEPQVVAQAMAGADWVFHLAASVGHQRAIADPLTDAASNIQGTLLVLEAARQQGVRKLVFSSSAAIFGELLTLPIREDHPAEPDTPYGVSKLAAEKYCLSYARLHHLPCVCLRYFNVYGPRQRFDAYGNVIPIFVFKTLRGEPLVIYGDGEQTRDFVHVSDVVQANLLAAQAPAARGAYNIGSGRQVTINQLVALLATAGGLAPVVSHGPPRAGDVRHCLADHGAATRDFGFAPGKDLAVGLAEYVAWARQAEAAP